MITVIPAILPQTYRDIVMGAEKVKDVVTKIQIDFVDGTFALNRTWGFNHKDEEKLSALLREDHGLPFWSEVDYEFDLMIANPLTKLDTFIPLGPSKIIFHVESITDEKELIAYLENLPEIVRSTVSFGMALNNDTDPVSIAPYASYITSIQCMGIAHIGSQGQPFDERVYGQIEKVRALYPDKTIAVDGAVSLENAHLLVERGVTELVVGSTVFQSGDPHGTIKKLARIHSS